MAWPAPYKNGTIPVSALGLIPASLTDPGTLKIIGKQYLHKAALADLKLMATAFQKQFGKALTVTQGYRPLGKPSDKTATDQPATQWAAWNWYEEHGSPIAAKPGTSNHGLALAVDLGAGVNVAGSAEHNWVVKNGPQWGWKWGAVPSEPWHVEHLSTVQVYKAPAKKTTLKAPAKTIAFTWKQIQKAINAHGYKPALAADNKPGPKTLAGIKWFQKAYGLAQDGIVGTATQAHLFPELKRGQRNAMVLFAKQILKADGYRGFVMNNAYGIGLARAVAKFKKANKIADKSGNELGVPFWKKAIK